MAYPANKAPESPADPVHQDLEQQSKKRALKKCQESNPEMNLEA